MIANGPDLTPNDFLILEHTKCLKNLFKCIQKFTDVYRAYFQTQ